jgi:putative SOS response-associated peptidase YedK
MCHHYRGSRIQPEHFVAEFSIRANLSHLGLGFDAWPLKPVQVVRLNESCNRELVDCEWGLLPLWWKPSDKATKRAVFQRKCFNAKSESVHEKPTFRDAFKRRRCMMPASEFFEKGHYLHRTFAFAGLWEGWHGDDGEVCSCTLLTTEPNAEVRGVGHHRMPVLLTDTGQYDRWLNPEIVERGPLEELMRPLAVGSLVSYSAVS